MIVFDGVYSFVSLILSMASLFISNYISKKDGEKFPFGKHVLEPLIVCVKSAVIATMCLISLSGAVQEISEGGTQVNYGLALMYSLVSVIGCGYIYLYMKKKGRKLSSELIHAESSQWLMDTILSGAVLVGFAFASIISKTSLSRFTVYIDPLMVITISIIFIRVPISTFINSFKEIICVKADDYINNDIYLLVKEIKNEYNFEDAFTRVSKVGRALRIEIDFVYSENSKLKDLDQMDYLRERISLEMNHINYNKWLSVSFTGDRKWAV